MDPAARLSGGIKSRSRFLKEYYTAGDWRKNDEADEAELLPPDLKRGVLSQDGVYNLRERLGEK